MSDNTIKPFFLWKHLNKLRWVSLSIVFVMLIYLPYAPPNFNRRHLRHRLDDNGGTGADSNLPNLDDFRSSSFNHAKIVACFRSLSKLKYHQVVKPA